MSLSRNARMKQQLEHLQLGSCKPVAKLLVVSGFRTWELTDHEVLDIVRVANRRHYPDPAYVLVPTKRLQLMFGDALDGIDKLKFPNVKSCIDYAKTVGLLSGITLYTQKEADERIAQMYWDAALTRRTSKPLHF